ncbi:DUF2064 domain-containing protein [Pseudonocardia sp. EC080619-01]|uniref:TIGR04282 family arsenosugar biosynthesis glycosyltransferase n=1 Tax=Pseudonocardia sp. EC080619-01 TaxID=1096856 RepID=UPI0009EB6B5A|nr:DUF2064 domain-containing protein [Pseudonocardia sp. EC080619-01]
MSTPAAPPRAAVLVLAKAPEPGLVKTRLCPPATPGQAAGIAAAALLDTLDATTRVPGSATVVALAGDIGRAVRADALRRRLGRTMRIGQCGDALGPRIANAHADVAARWPGLPTVQVGMDTPQLTPALLDEALTRLDRADAALGPAADGGWWAVALRDPTAATLLADVPTSRSDTGERTIAALRAGGLRGAALPELTDVDTMADALAVAEQVPGSRFAAAVGALTAGPVTSP